MSAQMHRRIHKVAVSLPKPMWLIIRAVVVIAVTAGYYILVGVLGGGLLYAGFCISELNEAWYHFIFIPFWCIGTLIVLSFPSPHRFRAPGPRLDPQEHPLLFERVRKVAWLVGIEMPAEIYATAEPGAWATYRGGIMSFGGIRILCIGLPLQTIG